MLVCTIKTNAQDSNVKIPKRAGLYSAIVPGLGQIYSGKSWKVPIIYGGLITSAYFTRDNHNLYELYKTTYLNRLEGNRSDDFTYYSDNNLLTLKDYYRRNREISVLLFTLTYILNIVDASVSAHLFNYDISEDLSLYIQPSYIIRDNAHALSLYINL